jgi:hypothetical protein
MAMLVGCGAAPSVQDEKNAIAAILHQQYDGTAVAEVAPIILRRDYAVAGWTHDDAGGRALLNKEKGAWRVVAIAGEEMRDAQFLQQAGLSEKDAKALSNMVIAGERDVAEERLAKLDSFDEPVRR